MQARKVHGFGQTIIFEADGASLLYMKTDGGKCEITCADAIDQARPYRYHHAG